MGTRSNLPLALRRARGLLPLAALLLAGCFDFVGADLPEAGAPAVVQLNVYADETGFVRVDGMLVTALTEEGFLRTVPDDTLRVSGLRIPPAALRPNGTRDYLFSTTVPDPAAFVRPLQVVPPTVTGIEARTPVVSWFSLHRADPDTILVRSGDDVTLNLTVEPGRSEPLPDQRLWTMDLVSDAGSFRFGGPGQPPATIRIPAYWVPAAQNGRVSAYLTYFLSGTYRPEPGDYLLSQIASLRIKWNIRLMSPS